MADLPLGTRFRSGRLNTSNYLTQLAGRGQPALRLVRKDGERWVAWEPLGPQPETERFERLLDEYKALDLNGSHTPGAGHATLSSMVKEVVAITATEYVKSSTWPAGHSVQISHLRAATNEHDRAKELNEHLTRRGRTVGAQLSEVVQHNLDGRRRVQILVDKVGTVAGSGPYYDVPSVDGYERRVLVVPYNQLREELSPARTDALRRELRAAEGLSQGAALPAIEAISRSRRATVLNQLGFARSLVERLRDNSMLLSKTINNSVVRHAERLNGLLEVLGSEISVLNAADEVLDAFGLTVEQVVHHPRPLMTPRDYAQYVPNRAREGLTDPELIARVVSLRRFPNPDFVSRRSEDPRESAVHCVDRAEALCYLAERYQGRVFNFLASGRRLLGRDFRHPALVKHLTREGPIRSRTTALAALVLVDPDTARTIALEWLHDERHREALETALHTLLVCRSVDPSEWPLAIRQPQNSVLRQLRTDVIMGSRVGRWLLQR